MVITPSITQRTMVQLLRCNATMIQLVFALLWSLRFVSAVGAPEVAAGVAIAGAFALRMAWNSTRGPRAREVFRTAEGRRFMRPVTRLTIAQIVGSIVLPGIVGAVGAEQWFMPIVAATIGLFLFGFGRPLHIPAVSRIGVAATVAPLCLPLALHGDALIALTSTSMMVALLSSAWCCAFAARRDTALG